MNEIPCLIPSAAVTVINTNNSLMHSTIMVQCQGVRQDHVHSVIADCVLLSSMEMYAFC